jgi:hypothetical protein
MTNLGLNVGVLNRVVSFWQRCSLREVLLYFMIVGLTSHQLLVKKADYSLFVSGEIISKDNESAHFDLDL